MRKVGTHIDKPGGALSSFVQRIEKPSQVMLYDPLRLVQEGLDPELWPLPGQCGAQVLWGGCSGMAIGRGQILIKGHQDFPFVCPEAPMDQLVEVVGHRCRWRSVGVLNVPK